ncbi:insulinase family protein [Phytohalomonas tamaricis]|uniref:insulinase family protein n=1 Tax=Phytohalomonas tamaricis TaxID=2081032 RepID=UPI000D0BC52F|nr:insulinase family protein [Phytohalomonas tamaricis]
MSSRFLLRPFSGLLASATLFSSVLGLAPVNAYANSVPSHSHDSSEQRVIKSPNDPRDYRALTLDNGLEVILVSDPKADKAAASMNIDVGSAFDPEDVPGLAHFLEHMLFLGTERFPEPGGYQDFISQHGGDHNAFTASTDTNYFFDIDPEALPQALDRFSQFFIAPLFNADYVDRERHAVHSEYQARIRDDARRVNDAINQVLNPDHPFHRFSVGSLDTLKDGDVPLRQRLIDFYHQHYDANMMHLAVTGPQSLDELETLVRQRFAAVPNRHLTKPTIDVAMATDAELPARLDVKSLREERQATFYFPIPDPEQDYRIKPASYLANLLGHEGKGSLLAQLRNAGWADGLSAGTADADGEHALFAVDIDLTPEGAKHLGEIQASLFAYLELVRDHGIAKWRYDEQASLDAQQFRFQQSTDPTQLVMQLTSNMARYPLEDVRFAPYRMDQFDKALIRRYLSALTPDNLLRVYSGPSVQGGRTSPWFAAPYHAEHIDQWPQATALGGLALPDANPFIANDFQVLDLDDKAPQRLVDEQGFDLWYRPDSHFGVPRVEWRFSLQNPHAGDDVHQLVLTELLAGWLGDSLNARLYPARLAGQQVSAYAHGRGMTLAFSGWRDRQPLVIREVIDQLKQGDIDRETFERIKLNLKQQWLNQRQAALYEQMNYTLVNTLIRPQWLTEQQLDAIDDLSVDDLRAFRRQWLGNLHLQAMAVGNLTAAQAQEGGNIIADALNPKVALSAIPDLDVLRVTDELPALRPVTERNDAGALRYLQGSDRSLDEQARLAVIGQLIQAPFYTQLRTEEQLGYVVYARYQPLMDAPGLGMLIQSPSQSSETLFMRMEAFLDQFDNEIDQLDEKTLAPYRNAVRESILERDKRLDQMTDRLWRELAADRTSFDRQERLAKRVDALDADDIKRAWHDLRKAPELDIAADPDVPANTDQRQWGEELSPLPKGDE